MSINTSQEQARNFLDTILCFVQGRNELSKSMVGRLLEQCGIKGKSGQKQTDVRNCLVNAGILIKQRNYFCDKASGYRHGNFYICGLLVEFQEEAQPHTPPHTVSIYLSFVNAADGDDTVEWREVVMEQRRQACERRYRERIRRFREVLMMAA